MSFSIQQSVPTKPYLPQLLKIQGRNLEDYVPILSYKDVPSTTLQNCNFSFNDIAKELYLLVLDSLSNATVKEFLANPFVQDKNLIQKYIRVIQNIALNACNNPHIPTPDGYMKKITFCQNDGTILVDVNTYVDSVPSLNYNKNVITISNKFNPVQSSSSIPNTNNNSDFPLANPFNTLDLWVNPNNIDPTSIKTTTPGYNINVTVSVNSAKNYHFPADEIDPPITGGNPISYKVLDNCMSRSEFQQANIQGWGWCSRQLGNKFSPSYNVATLIDAMDTNTNNNNGYYFLVSLSFVKIN